MVIHRTLGVLAAAVVAGLAGSALGAAPSDPDVATKLQALESEVQAQRAEIQELRAEKGDTWLNDRRQEEVKTLVREVLADADTRASLLESQLSAGWNAGKGFFLASEDGGWLLQVGGFVQFRYVFDHRENPGAGVDPDVGGFTLRRTRLQFAGNAASPKITYKFVFDADRDVGTVNLLEGWLAYGITDELTLVGGRFKAPFTREYTLPTNKLPIIDTSYVDVLLNAGYVEGLNLTWTQEWFRLSGSFNDGLHSGDLGSVGPTHKDFYGTVSDFAFTGRADIKVLGEWKQWDDLESWSSEKPALFLGGAVHYQRDQSGIPASSTGVVGQKNEFLRWTADATFKGGGFTIMGSATGNHTDIDPEAGNTNDYGFVGQAGYFVIPDKLEPYGRFEYYNPTTGPTVKLVTMGANYFFNKHQAKFSADVVWALDPIAASPSPTGLGLQANPKPQVVARAQFQFIF